MELKEYLLSRRLEQKEFAKIVGVSPASINNYLTGRRKPTLAIGRAIEKATNGKVTIDDLIKNLE